MQQYTVGIPVRNEESTLEDCVDVAVGQTLPPEAVLICLNGSNDETVKVADKLTRKYDNVRVIWSEAGKPRACNEIIHETPTDLILFTDGDAYLHEEAGERMVRTLDENPDCCVTGGNLFYMVPPHDFLLKPLFEGNFNQIYEVKNLAGACYMVRKGRLGEIAFTSFPGDIVNEDAFIGALARAHNKFVKADTYVKVLPVSTLRDYLKNMLRVRKGYLQLEERYPDLFADGRTLCLEDSKDIKRPLMYKVLRNITNALVKGAIVLSDADQSVIWDELRSTKVKCI